MKLRSIFGKRGKLKNSIDDKKDGKEMIGYKALSMHGGIKKYTYIHHVSQCKVDSEGVMRKRQAFVKLRLARHHLIFQVLRVQNLKQRDYNLKN